MLKWIKDWMLPLSILVGGMGYRWFWPLGSILPYLIFAMLLLAFCRLSPGAIRFRVGHGWLLLVQIGGGAAIYFLLIPIDKVIAEGAMISVLAPTAATSAVVTSLLGGDMGFLTGYMLVSYIAMAIVAPPLFSLAATTGGAPFAATFFYVCRHVMTVVIFPLLLAWGLRRFIPKVHRRLESLHGAAFYIWALSLVIVTAQTLHLLTGEAQPDHRTMVLLATVSLFFCIGQFLLGRYIGRLSGDPVSGGQGLGQKNTILAIWMAQTYLTPISFVAPAAYVLWQTIVNAVQLHRHSGKKRGDG
ncbi:MAG: transporter [Tannerellaceae bacterium]|nr:transporter [Tannerellaceae bacterium]